jgi:DNA-binding CsgD family transcriptional regulator
MTANPALQQIAPAEPPQSDSVIKNVLTSKELKVVELLSYGYENSDIASHFQTSKQAVKNMLRTINLKLGADNRTHAVAVCFRNGWLTSREDSDQSATDTLRVAATRKRTRPRCARRRYHDGSIDSVCTECGLVIARAWRLPDLAAADRNHICQRVERRHKVRFVLDHEPAVPAK